MTWVIAIELALVLAVLGNIDSNLAAIRRNTKR